MFKIMTRLQDYEITRKIFLCMGSSAILLPLLSAHANFDYVCWSSQTTCSTCENWSAWNETTHTRTCIIRRAYRTGKWGNTRVRCSTSDQFDTWKELLKAGDKGITGYGNSLSAEKMTTREGILFIGSALGKHTVGSTSTGHTVGSTAQDRWETLVNGNTCADVLIDYDYNPPRTTLEFKNK